MRYVPTESEYNAPEPPKSDDGGQNNDSARHAYRS
jgi:hypothetical protein